MEEAMTSIDLIDDSRRTEPPGLDRQFQPLFRPVSDLRLLRVVSSHRCVRCGAHAQGQGSQRPETTTSSEVSASCRLLSQNADSYQVITRLLLST